MPPSETPSAEAAATDIARATQLADLARASLQTIEPHPVVLAKLFLCMKLFEAQRGNVVEALRKLAAHWLLLQGLVEWLEDAHDREEG